MKRRLLLLALSLACLGAGPGPDWNAVGQEAVDLLTHYIRFKTVNPPADTREPAAWLESLLQKEGVEVKRYESAPGSVNLLARLPATGPPAGPPVMLLHHMDVVPADPSRWPQDPFLPTLKDGQLYGRGSMDMKSLGVIHLLAFLCLHRQHVRLQRDVLLLASCDEESGGEHGASWMIDKHWADMAPEYVLDEGGFGSRDLLAADGRLVFAVSVAEKQILWGKLVAEGTAGHGSQPIPDNANVRLVEGLERILRLPSPPGHNLVLDELRTNLGELRPNKFTNAIEHDTVSLTTLKGGSKVNVIPSQAEATLDCRLLPGTDMDAFAARLAPPGGPVRLEVSYRMDQAPVSSSQTPLFASLRKAILAEHPEAVVTPFLIPYGTDSNAFRIKGAKAYGLSPMVLNAAIVASMHSDAEHVPVDELGRGVRIFYDALVDFCALQEPKLPSG